MNAPPVLQDVTGTYVGLYRTGYDDTARFGPDEAWGGEVSFDASVVLDIEQSGSDLSGSWALDGEESWGGAPVGPVSLTGTFIGNLGPEESIELTLATCGTEERVYGVVSNNGRRIRLWGRFPLADSSCNVWFTTPATIFALEPSQGG